MEFKLEDTTKDFRKRFLVAFTKELVKIQGGSFPELKQIIKTEKSSETPWETKEIIRKEIKKLILPQIKQKPKILKMPRPKIPDKMKYLTKKENYIDLGKLNEFIKDKSIQAIECNGADEEIVIKKESGEEKTAIKLNNEEIKLILEEFSKESKTPIKKGIFHTATENLEITAIISDISGTKFIITKREVLG